MMSWNWKHYFTEASLAVCGEFESIIAGAAKGTFIVMAGMVTVVYSSVTFIDIYTQILGQIQHSSTRNTLKLLTSAGHAISREFKTTVGAGTLEWSWSVGADLVAAMSPSWTFINIWTARNTNIMWSITLCSRHISGVVKLTDTALSVVDGFIATATGAGEGTCCIDTLLLAVMAPLRTLINI